LRLASAQIDPGDQAGARYCAPALRINATVILLGPIWNLGKETALPFPDCSEAGTWLVFYSLLP
jgi:hypothetical protein